MRVFPLSHALQYLAGLYLLSSGQANPMAPLSYLCFLNLKGCKVKLCEPVLSHFLGIHPNLIFATLGNNDATNIKIIIISDGFVE